MGALSVPRSVAPLVTDWGSAGINELRARMLLTTARAAILVEVEVDASWDARCSLIIRIKCLLVSLNDVQVRKWDELK